MTIDIPSSVEDRQRLSLLAELGVLGTDPEPGFDSLTRAAAALTSCPIALISLVDGDRQWFKARRALHDDHRTGEWPFCGHAIRTPELMEVGDATADIRFATNPLVVGTPRIRFYAGQPLTVGGVRIGTLCVVDTKARELSTEGREALQDLGAAVSAMLAERRRRALSADQQRRLTEFAMIAGDWLWETDDAHRIVWMSSANGTHPAVPEPWTLGQPMADGLLIGSPGAPTEPQSTLHQLFDRKLNFARALVQCEVGGTLRHFSHSAISRHDPSGEWIGYRGITRDLTTSVAEADAHRTAATLLADLSAQVPGVIFQMRLESDGRLTFPFVSNRIVDFCGLSAARLMETAKAVLARCHRDDVARVVDSYRMSAVCRIAWQQTFRMLAPEGERTVMVHAEPKPLEGGGVLWHGILTDVTERVLATQHLQEMSLAQAAAEKAVEVRSEFMSRVSHELRTPLNAILGFAQMLRMQGPDVSGRSMLESVSHIETAGAHLLDLVNDMLDLTSLDAGRLVLDFKPVALAPLIARCIAMVEPHGRQHGIIFELHAREPIPSVRADARAVKQILFNLLGNAVKFAQANTVVWLELWCDRFEEGVQLSITDRGPGIPPDKLSVLFDPFVRVASGRSSVSGSGLGLSISQKLVHAMSGRIEVASRLGQGTTFTLTFPADERSGVSSAGTSVFGELQSPSSLQEIGGGVVLYIEDEPVNALVMQALFESMPDHAPRLVVATTGEDGLVEARRLMPDLILLDMNLPDQDGLSVLAKKRRDTRIEHIPVIAVSADALPEQIDRAMAAGCQGYWAKPMDLSIVLSELRRRFPSDGQAGEV
jgi:signal transduction histidine kinase/CheY-like chemotaxis protein